MPWDRENTEVINPSPDIAVVVACPEPGMENVLAKIRRWGDKERNRSSCTAAISSISKELCVQDAIRSVREQSTKNVLIAIGYKPSDVCPHLSDAERRNVEVILRPPRPGPKPETNEFPTSSLLEDEFVVNVQDPIRALRKSVLRLRLRDTMRVRELESDNDFRQYFSLRYKVWKQMGYIAAERDCPESRWEVDFTDRTALPIGAFHQEGTLIGCARLVFPLGKEVHHVPLIRQLVRERQDEGLTKNLTYPRTLIQPFDILESLSGFREYYERLVKRRVSKAEVSRVIVAPEFQHRGLGEVLVDSLVSLARSRQVQELFLACHKRNKGFYENCGFHVLEGLACDSFAGVNAPAIAMARELTRTL
jgi:N-acetylglutamate synthase-like GNAT family acetyltransferase